MSIVCETKKLHAGLGVHTTSMQTSWATCLTLSLVSCEFIDELLTSDDVINFYVYDEFDWLVECEKDDKNTLLEFENSPEYGAEIAFLRGIKSHPWRTENPESAKIFIFPVLWSYLNLDQLGWVQKISNCHKFNLIKIHDIFHSGFSLADILYRNQAMIHPDLQLS